MRWPLGRIDPTVPLLICQVYAPRVASHLKLALARHYPDEHEALVVRAAGVPGEERVERRPLYALDRGETADHLSSVWVPPLAPLQAVREPQTLQEVMTRLRAPDGCPWDREQTHEPAPYLLEETYEALEALDGGTRPRWRKSWGPAAANRLPRAGRGRSWGVRPGRRRGRDRGQDDPAATRTSSATWRPRMPGRCCATGRRSSAASARARRSRRSRCSTACPAPCRRWPTRRRCRRAPPAWDSTGPTWTAWWTRWPRRRARSPPPTSEDERAAELGDLLFTLVNLARRSGVDAEDALRSANHKFRTRFAAMEAAGRHRGEDARRVRPAGLDALWTACHEGECAARARQA